MQGPVSTSELHNLLELSVKISAVVEEVESFFNFRLPKPLSFEVQGSAGEAVAASGEASASQRPAYLRGRGSTEPILSYSMNQPRATDGREVAALGSSPMIHSANSTPISSPSMNRADSIYSQPRGASSAAVFTSQPTSVPGGSAAKTNAPSNNNSNSNSVSRPRKNSSAAELVSMGNLYFEFHRPLIKFVYLIK